MRDAYFYKRPPIFGEIRGRLSPVAPQPVDNQLSAISEHPVQNRVIYSALDGKVDKVTGKGLSTNDYTDAEKTKLANIADGATRVIVDSAIDGTSANPVKNAAVKAALDTKVDKVVGKALSTNDYTNAEKTKLAGIESQANKTIVDSAMSSSSTNPVQNAVVQAALDNKVDKVWGKGLSANDYTTAEKIKLAGIDDGANKTVMDATLDYTSSNPLTNAAVCAALDNIIAAVDDVDDKTPPAGGTTGQVLVKNSNADYDYKWAAGGGGGGGSVNDVTVAGTSVLDGDTAKVPKAKSARWGVVQIESVSAQPTVTDYTAVTYAIPNGGGEADKTDKLVHLDLNNLIPAKALPDATTTTKGAMSAADKARLDEFHGVPIGGVAGYVLKKASSTDYDTVWAAESDPKVFVAAYGTTTNAQIEAAYQAGSVLFCSFNLDGVDYLAPLAARFSTTSHMFQVTVDFDVLTLVCTSNTWENDIVFNANSDDVAVASDATPASLGVAGAGVSDDFSRADHVHAMPTAANVGAIPTPSSPSNGDVLTWNGTAWVAAAPTGGGGGVLGVTQDQDGYLVLSPVSAVTEEDIDDTGAVTAALDPNVLYHFTGSLTSLTITLNTPQTGMIAHYHFDFVSGSTAATLTLPQTVVMPSGFSVAANTRYEIDILNNYACVQSWAVSS